MRSGEYDQTITDDGNYTIIHDLTRSTHLTAGLGIGTTIFVCILLATSAIIFSYTTNILVINPIEKMVSKVKRISENPILASQEEENEALTLEKLQEEQFKRSKSKKGICKLVNSFKNKKYKCV